MDGDRRLIRIFIADDHAIVRHGLRQLIDAQLDMRVVGEAHDGRQVLHAAEAGGWDILLLDLSLPRVNGLEVLRRLHAAQPSLRIVALSMYPEEQYAARVLHEGAVAYISKQQPPEELLQALRTVMRGGTYVSAGLGDRGRVGDASSGVAAHEKLSAREYQIFTLILQNHTPSEIAAELNLSLSTVSNHLAHVKDKLGVRTLGEIISYGHRASLIEVV